MAFSYAKRFGEVHIDWRALGVDEDAGEDFHFVGGQRVLVEPFAGLRLVATGISVREGAEGARTWMGRIEGPTSGQITITRHRDAMFGSVDYGLERYVLQSGRDGRIFVREADQRGLGRCAFDARAEGLPRFDQGLFDRRASTSASAAASTDEKRPASAKPTAPSSATAKSNGHATIDILVLYTPEVAAGAGGNPQAMIQNYVDHANVSFMDGQIQGSLNLVGTSLITGVNQALGPRDTWQTRSEELQAGTGVFSGVPGLRNNLNADLVALLVVATPEWIGGQWVSPVLCGAAMGSSRANQIDVPAIGSELGAHSITDIECSAADLTFTHEIGHNLGGLHGDPGEFSPLANTSIQEFAIVAATRHSLGYSRDEALHPFRTLMGSNTVNGDTCARQGDPNGCPRVNRWSSPNQVYHVGGWFPYPLGGPTGRCLSGTPAAGPCGPANPPQFTDMVGSHQYAMPLVAQYRGAPFAPLTPIFAGGVWAHANCKHPPNTVVISWSPQAVGPSVTHYELESSPLPGFPWWQTSLLYSGPQTSHFLQISAWTYLRLRACGGGGCSDWVFGQVQFPFPPFLPPPAC
jgi:hypothetical protein